MYKHIIFEIPKTKELVLKDDEVITSSNINEPQLSLGFHYFLHRTKNSMEITKNIESKGKFYYVVNPFEHMINDYKEDLNHETLKYFGLKKSDPSILSRAFYKMWEILTLFNIADQDKLILGALAEGPGAFIQAVIHYRKKFHKSLKNDKLFGVTIHPEKDNFIHMGKKFMNYYKKNHASLLKIHKTYTKSYAGKSDTKDNGDITQVKTIANFKKDILKTKKYANLVTADGGFRWNDENYQEQEAYILIFGEIVAALRIQAKGGHFVLKLFESFTDVTLKMIAICCSFYKECYIYKPFFSRESNSEKYLICKDFIYNQDKKLDDKLKILESVLTKMKTKEFIFDIFPKMELDKDFKDLVKYINIDIMNRQQIMINKIITFIKSNNYYGEKFHNYKEDQIKATKWWLNTFYPKKDDVKSFKPNINNLNDQIKFNSFEIKNFKKSLVSL